jgi:hypothetical protein
MRAKPMLTKAGRRGKSEKQATFGTDVPFGS